VKNSKAFYNFSLDAEVDVDVESKWDEEIRKRVADIKSGRAKGRAAEDILAEIRANFHEDSNCSSRR